MPREGNHVGALKVKSSREGRCYGFTLIELLVVIAIISLLVSILLPSLQQAKELAKRAACLSNLRSLGVGLVFYADEYDEWFISNDCSLGDGGTTNYAEYFYPDRLRTPNHDYLAGLAGLWRGSYAADWASGSLTEKPRVFECPSNENQRTHYSSYSYRGVSVSNSWLAKHKSYNVYGKDKLSDPGRKGMIVDSFVWTPFFHDTVFHIWFSDGSASAFEDEYREIVDLPYTERYRRWEIWRDILDVYTK